MNKKYIILVDAHPESAVRLFHDLGLSSPENFFAITPGAVREVFDLPELQSENLLVITGSHITPIVTKAFAQRIRVCNPLAKIVLRSTTVFPDSVHDPVFDATLTKDDETGLVDQISLVLTR